MDQPENTYVQRNNYNYALNEEFDYLDELKEELKNRTIPAEPHQKLSDSEIHNTEEKQDSPAE